MPFKDPIKRKEYMKEYRKKHNQTPQSKKTFKICKWKSRGLIGNYDYIYDRYINTTHCDLCNVELCDGLKGGNKKVMDHCHITGLFRNVVCNTCNSNKSDKKIRCNNKSGYKNIHYRESQNRWVYNKTFKGKTIYISRKNKIDILCIKFAGIILFNY